VPLWRGISVSKAVFFISFAVPNEQGVLIILQSHFSLKVPGENITPPDSHSTEPSVKRQAYFQGLLLHMCLPRENNSLVLAHTF